MRRSGGQAVGRSIQALVSAAGLLTAGPPDRLTAVVQCPDGSPPPCRAARPDPGRQPGLSLNSVAVLYFENLSSDTADAFLAPGLTDEIIARLGQIDRLVVKSRTAVQRHRHTTQDPSALGQALGVAYLVNGTVRRAGARLRVTVELVRAVSGDQVWGARYDRADTDLLDIQEAIAEAVATEIAGRLVPTERARLGLRATRDARAYEHFLRGNHLYAQRSPSATLRAIEQYQAALRRDPRLARALARVALCYHQFIDRAWDYPGLPAETLLTRALAATDQALRIDSGVADAWIGRAFLLAKQSPRTYAGVSVAIRQAVAVEPRSADAWHAYAVVLRDLGDDSGSVEAFRRTLAIEPDRAVTLALFAWRRLVDRLYAEATRLADSAIALEPGLYLAYSPRALARLELGDTAAARRDAEAARRLSPPGYTLYADVTSALVEAAVKNHEAAWEHLERHLTQAPARLGASGEREALAAMALVALGETDRALDVLDRAPRTPFVGFGLRFPAFDPLRADPRFQRLVEESRPK